MLIFYFSILSKTFLFLCFTFSLMKFVLFSFFFQYCSSFFVTQIISETLVFLSFPFQAFFFYNPFFPLFRQFRILSIPFFLLLLLPSLFFPSVYHSFQVSFFVHLSYFFDSSSYLHSLPIICCSFFLPSILFPHLFSSSGNSFFFPVHSFSIHLAILFTPSFSITLLAPPSFPS